MLVRWTLDVQARDKNTKTMCDPAQDLCTQIVRIVLAVSSFGSVPPISTITTWTNSLPRISETTQGLYLLGHMMPYRQILKKKKPLNMSLE